MTTTTTRAEPSVLEVLKAGQCSASCPMSAGTETGAGAGGERRTCRCRCQGAYHGVVLSALTRQAETTAPSKLNRSTRRRQLKGRRAG
jgi:hypothetical protein